METRYSHSCWCCLCACFGHGCCPNPSFFSSLFEWVWTSFAARLLGCVRLSISIIHLADDMVLFGTLNSTHSVDNIGVVRVERPKCCEYRSLRNKPRRRLRCVSTQTRLKDFIISELPQLAPQTKTHRHSNNHGVLGRQGFHYEWR